MQNYKMTLEGNIVLYFFFFVIHWNETAMGLHVFPIVLYF